MNVPLVHRSLEVFVVLLHERMIEIWLEFFGGHRQCACTNRIDCTIAWIDASLLVWKRERERTVISQIELEIESNSHLDQDGIWSPAAWR